MVAKVLMQMVLFFIGLMMIGTFLLETAGRWSSSRGPLATARVIAKTEMVNPKAASNTFKISLKFKRQAGDSVVAITETSAGFYAAHSIGSLVPIHYQLHNPKNAIVATEGWFEWRTLAILAFGVALFYAGSTIKAGKPTDAAPETSAT